VTMSSAKPMTIATIAKNDDNIAIHYPHTAN
jgi:hypothetical protein